MNSTVSISRQPLIQCSVSGVHIRALIDTGSMKSFISAPIFNKISSLPVLEHNAPQCIRITGQQMFVEGTTQLELSFQGASMSASYECQFIVSSSLTGYLECVLGWDFLTSNGLLETFSRAALLRKYPLFTACILYYICIRFIGQSSSQHSATTYTVHNIVHSS